MTDAPNTIEEQMRELARQYTFLENVCKALRLDNKMREKKEAWMEEEMAGLRLQLHEARERQCRCAYADIPCQC